MYESIIIIFLLIVLIALVLFRLPIKKDDSYLDKVIKKQEGKFFFKLVEDVRRLSKANTANTDKKKSFQNLSNKIKNLSPINLFKLTRAFTHFMNFINIAESIDGARKLDEYENKKQIDSNKNIFIEEIFEDFFKDRKIPTNKIYDIAKNLNIGIVGAGIQGVCSALFLQKKGYQVTLFDRDEPGNAASYGNAGHFSPYASIPLNRPDIL